MNDELMVSDQIIEVLEAEVDSKNTHILALNEENDDLVERCKDFEQRWKAVHGTNNELLAILRKIHELTSKA